MIALVQSVAPGLACTFTAAGHEYRSVGWFLGVTYDERGYAVAAVRPRNDNTITGVFLVHPSRVTLTVDGEETPLTDHLSRDE